MANGAKTGKAGKPSRRRKKSQQGLAEAFRQAQGRKGKKQAPKGILGVIHNRLSLLEERFCQNYALDPKHNATQALIRAGYTVKRANQHAHFLLKKPKIKERIAEIWGPIAEAIKNRFKKTALTNKRLLEEDVAIMASDIRNYGQVLGGYFFAKDSVLWSDEAAAAVRSISQTEHGVKIQLHDKHPSLTRLMKIQKLLRDDPELPPGGELIAERIRFYLPEKRTLELSGPRQESHAQGQATDVRVPPKRQVLVSSGNGQPRQDDGDEDDLS